MKSVRKSLGHDSNRRHSTGGGISECPNNNTNNPTTMIKPSSRSFRIPSSPPTTIELRGVPIHFPFKPYKCQEDYMGTVLDALLRRENALLESPTGTGKTLCLLCATLAWQREEARKIKEEEGGDSNEFGNRADPAAIDGEGGTINDGVIGTIGSTTVTGVLRPQSRRVPTIIYASRTHSQLSQVVRELRNTRYRPKHAVLGAREQMCVNPKVKKSTATASAINHDCSVLTKDHKCQYKNKLDGFTPPTTDSSTGGWFGTQPVMDMEDLLLMGNTHKVCPFYYTRDLVENAELVLVPYNYLFDKDARTSTLAEVPWDNAVVIFDEAHNLEAFASDSASFDLSSRDIAGCMTEVDKGITYLEMDPDRFGHTKRKNLERLKNVFLRLEEYILRKLPTHRTAYMGEKMMDIFAQGAWITYANYVTVLAEIKNVSDIFLEIRGGNTKGTPRLEHFVQCLKRVFGEVSEARCLAKAQSYRVHVSPPEGPSSQSNFGGGSGGGRTISYWCFAPSEAMRELADLNVRSFLVTSGTLSPLESYALELDLPFPNRLENPHIIASDQIHVRVMGRGVSQKLLTSSYERRQETEYYLELGNTLASLSRVIPGGMLVFFPSYGVMETSIEKWGGPAASRSSSSSNTNRGTEANFFARRQTKAQNNHNSGRYSFPQHQHSSDSSGSNSTPWTRLRTHKAVVIEPRTSSDLPDAIEEFHKYLNMPKSKGVVLFGVCRGKISEGIDFAHDMCRAVIVTGLPFAPSFDPKVQMKREFLDQNRAKESIKSSNDGGFGIDNKKLLQNQHQKQNSSLSGHQWYTQQAHRAVNQAIGRVIRNLRDYGAVLLLDSRFELPGNQTGLSKWVRPHILPDEGFGKSYQALIKFYGNAKQKEDAARQEILPPVIPDRPTNVSVILRYEEDEGKENNRQSEPDMDSEEISKVAFIGKQSRNPAQVGEESRIEGYIPPQRIIARVDMTTSEGSKKASEVLRTGAMQDEDVPSSLSMSPTSSLLPSNKEQKDMKPRTKSPPPMVSAVSEAKKVVRGAPPPPSAARQFFEEAQITMSSDELTTVKKAVVLMKNYTELRYRKEFLDAATEVLQLILNHRTFENQGRDQKPELIVLFLQLLPKHFITDGENRTMELVFRKSLLRLELKSSLPHNLYSKIYESFVSVLRGLWFDIGGVETKGYVKQLEKILSDIVKNGNISFSSLSSVTNIVPSEVRQVTTAILDQLQASTNVSKMKEVEKARTGENAIRLDLFRKSYEMNQPLGEGEDDATRSGTALVKPEPKSMSTETNSAITTNSKVDDRTIGPSNDRSESQHDVKERKQISSCNPYARSKNPYSTGPPPQSCNTHAPLAPAGSRGENDRDNDAHKSKRITPRGFSLKKILQQSEEDMYTGIANRPSKILKLSSNAPMDLTCTICALPQLDKPYISDCGHIACLKCWQQWLVKSQTCPVCRKPASYKSIALAVFQQDTNKR